jgi:hypothetical protein
MPQTPQTVDEVLDSMTGHEESWVAEQFGRSIGELVQLFLERNDVGPYYRAVIFVLKRRDGVTDDDARNAVLDMKLKDVVEFFPREKSAEPDEVAAVEESGKDDAPSEPLRVISPASAS